MSIIDGFILLFGCVLSFSGYRSIKKRFADTDMGAFEGNSAVNLGWFWLTAGVLCVLAIVFDIKIIKSAILFFLGN
jgi:hypothetical protein